MNQFMGVALHRHRLGFEKGLSALKEESFTIGFLSGWIGFEKSGFTSSAKISSASPAVRLSAELQGVLLGSKL
jgi:hypothetical protein